MTINNNGTDAAPAMQEQMYEFPDEGNLFEPTASVGESGGVEGALGDFATTQYGRSVGRIVANEFRATVASLRDSARPQTVSHALLFRDGQSTQEIQARLRGGSEADIELILSSLVSVNFVKRYEEDGVVRYRIDPPAEF